MRISGLGWDVYTGLHPDEGNLVRASAALAWPGRLVPEFHAYNGLAVWLPRLVAWPVCGWDASLPCVTGAARLISAVLGSAAVLVATLWARDLAGPVAAAAAAILFGASAPLIQWAHFGTTESALILAVLVLNWTATRAIDGRMTPWHAALVSAVTLGLGLGMKTTVLAFAVIPLCTLLILRQNRARAMRMALAGIGIAGTLWIVTTPAILLDWPDWLGTLRFENAVVHGSADVFWTWQFMGRTGGLYELRQLWGATEGAGLVLALIGMAWLTRDRALLRRMLPALVFALIYAAIILGWHARFFRYLAPLFPLVLMLAAIAAATLWSRSGLSSVRALVLVALALVAGNGLNRAAGYLSTDPRILAARDLAARVLPGDVILLEPRDVAFAGPPDHTATILPLDWPLDRAALAQTLSEGAFMILLSRRNWSVLPRRPERFPGACAYYHGLATGRLGYRLVARHNRRTPLGDLGRPGVSMEETRVVFDAPEVLVLENVDRLGPGDLAARLETPVSGKDCAPESLADLWRVPK